MKHALIEVPSDQGSLTDEEKNKVERYQEEYFGRFENTKIVPELLNPLSK